MSIIVLVTGGNAGIGLATVSALLRSSKPTYTAILGSRSLDRGKAAAESLSGEIVGNVYPVQLDIEDEGSVDRAVKEIEEKYGRLDVLVNNAGVSCDPFAEGDNPSMTPRQVWSKSFDLNVISTHFITHAFVPLLLKSSNPRIIFNSTQISSLVSHGASTWPIDVSPPAGWPKEPHGALPAYRSSKAAVNMMAKEWAKMLKNDGVKVNIVALGKFATALGGESIEEQVKMGVPAPEVAGEFVKSFIEGKHDEETGFVGIDGVVPW